MSRTFERRLRRVIENLPYDMQPQAKRNLNLLLKANVWSSDSLQALLINPEANHKLRLIACWFLGRLDDKRVIQTLLSAFMDQNVEIQWEAAKSISLIRSKRAVNPLIKVLVSASDTERRIAASYALGLLKDERAVTPLIDVLNNKNEHPKLRGQVAEALSYFNNPEATASLLKALKDKQPEVRFWSVFALGQLRIKKALPELKRLAHKDHTPIRKWWTISREAKNAIHNIEKKAEI